MGEGSRSDTIPFKNRSIGSPIDPTTGAMVVVSNNGF